MSSLAPAESSEFPHSDSYVTLDNLEKETTSSGGGQSYEVVEEEVEYEEEVVYEDVEEEEEPGSVVSEPSSPQTSTAPVVTDDSVAAEDAHAESPLPASQSVVSPAKPVQSPELVTVEEGGVGSKPSASVEAVEDQSTQAASTSTSSPAGGTAGVDYDLKQLEAQAAKVAKDVQEVAKDVSKKLSAGLKSAFGGAPNEAGASLTKLAGGFSSWWNSLDPAPQPVRDETAERVQSSNKASSELQDMFGLSAEENLVEQFKCKLLQTYACNHNSFTPAIQMAFQGTMFITDKHTCFSVEERGRKLPFKVAHTQVIKATRQRPQRKGDLSDILKMEMSSGQWLAFKDFDSGSALDSALALVEHLMEGA